MLKLVFFSVGSKVSKQSGEASHLSKAGETDLFEAVGGPNFDDSGHGNVSGKFD